MEMKGTILQSKKGEIKFEYLAEAILENDYNVIVISDSPLMEHDAMYMKLITERVEARRQERMARREAADKIKIKKSGCSKIYIQALNRELSDGHSGGDHPFPFRTRKLSPPAYSAVLWCASPRKSEYAVNFFQDKFHIPTLCKH